MRAPRRLKDDPSVSSELRDALLEEEEVVEDYDLAQLRQRVIAGEPTAAPVAWRGAKWLAVVVVSGFTAAVVTLALQPAIPEPVAPTEAPVIEPIRTGESQLPHRSVVTEEGAAIESQGVDAPGSTDDDGAAALAEPRQPASTDPTPEPAAAEPPADQGAAASSEPAEAPSEIARDAHRGPPAPSGLAAELAAYNRGLDAAERGDWKTARDAYTSYLQAWPAGQMRTEGWLGLLTATVESSSPAAAERLAAQMLERGGLGSRRQDVVLVRAEALVELDRCDEALEAVAEFRRGSRVNSIKQSCKRARRSE